MSKALVDPAELRRFAHNLKAFNGDLQNRIAVMHSQLASLGQSWRDQEHDKFTAEFEQTLLVVNRFLEASDQHVPFLLRKAERIQEYLHQR